MIIRNATVTDECEVVRLLERSRLSARFDDPTGPTGFSFQYRPQDAAGLFLEHLCSPAGLVIVSDAGNRLTGVLIAFYGRHGFGPVFVACEKVWYIEEESRGSLRVMREFMTRYEEWAAGHGCSIVNLVGLGRGVNVAPIYERCGYQVAETHFLKRLG